MKHFCSAILTVMILFSLVTVPTVAVENKETIILENGDSYAIEYGDSIAFDSFEAELVRNKPSEKVIKLYNGYYMPRFSEQQDIHTMLADALEVSYMVISGKQIQYKHIYEGKITNVTYRESTDWREFYTYAVSPELVFEPSIEIYNTYCLDGSSSHNGVYIYYVTNKGNYVLYKEFLTYEEMYLFPLEDFYRVAKVIQDDRYLHRNEDGGGTPVSELVDLNQYIFTPRNHSAAWIPYVVISAVVLVGAVIVICLIIKKKGKKSKTFTESESQSL